MLRRLAQDAYGPHDGFTPFDDRVERCVVQRISIRGVFHADLRILSGPWVKIGAKHTIPKREECCEVSIAMLGRVMETVELRTGNPTTYGTEADTQIHVYPVSPDREHRPEPPNRRRLEVEQDGHRQVYNETERTPR